MINDHNHPNGYFNSVILRSISHRRLPPRGHSGLRPRDLCKLSRSLTMEAVLVPSSPKQSISPYRQIRNPKRNNRRFISKPSENLSPSRNLHGGLLLAPPPSLSSSFHSSALLFDHHPRHQQPPLLPLPVPKTYTSLPPRSPPINKKNKIRDQSLTPKKSKPSSRSPKKEDSRSTAISDDLVMAASTNRLGPDPKDLPKDAVSRILTSGNIVIEDLDKFSGSVFTLSPPPSSLPLPKFSLRPKLSCNAEAAGIDAGATDNLRRLLRLP
ncbi:hypothetical protein AAG906_018273 [Vitis piasezkii]